MAPRPRKKSDNEILSTACDCFLEHGPGVSIQLIADRVGLSQPALFKRFTTKKELMLAALLPSERPPIIEWLDNGPDHSDFFPQLRVLVGHLWATVESIVPRMAVLHTSGMLPGELLTRYKRLPYFTIIESVADWLRRAQQMGSVRPEVNPIVWAQSTMGTLQGQALVRFVFRSHMAVSDVESYITEDVDKYLDSVVELLYHGIAISLEK